MAVQKCSVQNQLQFNLCVPPVTTNLAVRFHHPKPIVVEKMGSHLKKHDLQDVSTISAGSVQFTSLSEEKLAIAVKLAQRDLRKKKLEDSFQKDSTPKTPEKTQTENKKSSRTRIVPSREYRERLKKGCSKEKKDLPVRERGSNYHPRQVQIQTNSRAPSSPVRKVVDTSLPATTNSPPTRDTDAYPARRSTSHDPRQEIERLQKEMEQYLQQIQVIEQRAVQEQDMGVLPRQKGRSNREYLTEEEDPIRKAIRAEELATRSARQIYFLRQQVREIQHDVIRIGPQKIRQTKKSQTMSRLAAAHRGAVRCIQAFVNHLPQQDFEHGLPTYYHELALLMRQLSLLSSELTGDVATKEDLIKMLNRVDELNQAWCNELKEKREKQAHKSAASTHGFTQPHTRPSRPLNHVQGRAKGKENKPKGLLKKTFRKIENKKIEQEIPVTPERQETLRAGLAALLKTRETDGLRAVQEAWAGKEKVSAGAALSQPVTHFADPTLASSLKAVTEQRNLVTDEIVSPRRARSHSRNRSLSPPLRNRSPNRPRTRSQSPYSSRRFLIQDVEGDVIKELFPSSKPKKAEQRGRSILRSPGINRSGVRESEQSVRQRLEPLLSKAESLNSRQQKLAEASRYSLRAALADRALNEIGVNEEALSDMILNDILHDTANELQHLEATDTAHKEALRMQDNPTLQGIYQQLEYMEQEQLDIRRRWVSAQYEEPFPSSKWRSEHSNSVPALEDRPVAPSAIKISRRGEERNVKRHVVMKSSVPQGGTSPIVFTKMKPARNYTEERTYLFDNDEEGHHHTPEQIPRTVMSLSENEVAAIHSQREKFERHLKKRSHHVQGKFNPWKLIEEISDQVLKECIEDIAKELEDVNDAIVSHVCKSEFMVAESTDVTTNIQEEESVSEMEEQSESESLQLHSDPNDVAL